MDSILFKMIMAQIVNPVRGDYYQNIRSIMEEVGIQNTSHEVKNMSKGVFRKLVKQKCNEAAFIYLKQKQARGSKGVDIKYSILQMADYLLPQANLSI